MNNLLFTIFAFFFHLIRDVVHFVRFGRPVRTFSMPARRPAPQLGPAPQPVPPPAPQNTLKRDPMAELALLKAENRATMREANALRRKMNERRRLEREAARARGELPPAKPRKPREPQQKSQPKTPPQALPDAPPTLTAAPNPIPLPQTQFNALPAAPPAIPTHSIPSRLMPSQVTTSQTTLPRPKPPRTLFKALSTIFTAPLRILKAALVALPRLFFRRRPPTDGPPAARPAAPSLQNRAA